MKSGFSAVCHARPRVSGAPFAGQALSSGLAANPSDRASPKVRDAIGKDTGHNQGGGGLPVLLYVLMQRHCVSSNELGDGGGVAGVVDGDGSCPEVVSILAKRDV